MTSSPDSRTQRLLEAKFKTLASQWEADTRFLSSATKMAEHPACQRIIDMGENVVPLVLGELAGDADMRWFEVLRTITGANPVAVTDAGKLRHMAEAWLVWGRERGYSIMENDDAT